MVKMVVEIIIRGAWRDSEQGASMSAITRTGSNRYIYYSYYNYGDNIFFLDIQDPRQIFGILLRSILQVLQENFAGKKIIFAAHNNNNYSI